MKFLIVGLGSIGRRHLRNLRLVMPQADVTVLRQHAKSGVAEGADRTVYHLEDALKYKPDVAIIASPATSHLQTALQLTPHMIHLFVEKPLSHSLEDVDRLLSECHRRNLVLMIGYNMRFNEALQRVKSAVENGQIGQPLSIRAEVGQYLPDWRPGADYRLGVSARRELGGGVLLELSHELDYARWLMGEVTNVQAQIGRVSKLEIDVEDIAELIFEFDSGVIGNIHLDMVQRVPTRICRIYGTEGTLEWDGVAGISRLYTVETGVWHQLSSTPQDRNQMYINELKHLIACIERGATPIVNGEDARRVLEIINGARRSAANRGVVEL